MTTRRTSPRKPSSKRKKQSKRKPILIALLSVFALLIIATLFLGLPLFLKEAPQNAIIKIPAGASRENVKDSVTKYLGDDYADAVLRMAAINRSDFSARHGAYLIPKGTSPFRAERRLSKGAQQPLTITINGFRSLQKLADKISARLDFSADSLMNAALNPDFLSKFSLTPDESLALFLDDSYEVYWSASPESILKKIGDNYTRVWDASRIGKAEALGLSPAEITIVSSIADEETNKTDEKGTIGRLYINRLNMGMPLQADPTIRFALNDFSIRRVKGEHLKADSPYNTYTHKGLPPGPIRTTSVTTIDKILDSAPSDYIYMCAKEDFSGYHNFAATYSEHQANARRYRDALDNRGIK